MSAIFSRKNAGVFARWWWTIDRWILSSILVLVVIGILLSFSSTPSVATRLNLEPFYFVKRHIALTPIALAFMICVSFSNSLQVRRLATLIFGIGIVFLFLTPLIGYEIKGAKRWINIFGFSMQISEIIKPVFAVFSAWMISEQIKDVTFPGIILSLVGLVITVVFLLLQPDMGMTFVMIMTWGVQIFTAGLPLVIICIFGVLILLGGVLSYFVFPHFQTRINQFLGSASMDVNSDLYQIKKSLSAFSSGGIWGRGPGEGVIKRYVPDAHADFVFSVVGEEFGFVLCFIIVAMFCIIMGRSLIKSIQENSIFVIMATSGLIMQLCIQAFVNIASTLRMIPTKGMTLPFISYGGSSMISTALTMGILLSLTKKKIGETYIF